jgi:hypothetical protein
MKGPNPPRSVRYENDVRRPLRATQSVAHAPPGRIPVCPVLGMNPVVLVLYHYLGWDSRGPDGFFWGARGVS